MRSFVEEFFPAISHNRPLPLYSEAIICQYTSSKFDGLPDHLNGDYLADIIKWRIGGTAIIIGNMVIFGSGSKQKVIRKNG